MATLEQLSTKKGFDTKIYMAVGFMSTMYASMLLASASVTAMAVDFPEIGTAGLQQILTINSITAAIMCLITGFLTTKIRVKTLSITSMIIMAIGGVGVTFCNSFTAILVLRMLYGIGMGLNHSLMPTVISWYLLERKRGVATGIKQSVGQAGTMVMTFLSGTLSVLNWRYPFYIYAFSLVVALIVFFTLPKKSEDIDIPKNAGSGFVALPKYAWGWVILLCITQVGIFVFQTNLSQLIVLGMGHTTVQTGVCGVLVAAGGICGGAALYKVNKTLDRWTIPAMLFLYAMTVLACKFFNESTPLAALYINCFIHGLVYFIYNGLIILQVGNAVEIHQKGFAVACGMAALQLGNFITPYVWVPMATAIFGRDMPQDRMLLGSIGLVLCAIVFAIIASRKARIAYVYHSDSIDA